MSTRLVVAVALLASGCAMMTPERITAWQHERAALQLGCVWADVTVSGTGSEGPWMASCAGRHYICRARVLSLSTPYERTEVECDETEASKAATYRRIVTDRLVLETSCAQADVAIVAEADWSRGGERAYRMMACGKPYVCTTAAGRTDCKAALRE